MSAGAHLAKLGIRMVITYIAVIASYFVVIRVLPVLAAGGNPLADPVIAALRRTAEDPRFNLWIEEAMKRFGLDRPLFPDQFILYMKNTLTYNFGISIFTQRPVLSEIAVRLPYTLSLYTILTILPIAVGYYLGIITAQHRGTKFDTALTQGAIISYIIPSWLILLLVYYFLAYLPKRLWGFYIFPLPVKPPSIEIANMEALKYLLWYMTPLIMAGTLAWTGPWIYFIRQIVVSELGSDYSMAALAKGGGPRYVLRKHVVPNVRPPLMVHLAYAVPGIFGGALIFEIVGNWPGIAYFSYQAFLNWDFPVMTAFFAISATLIVVSLFVAELLLLILDPRARTRGG
jgi:peptide/nickel transport system permease protein